MSISASLGVTPTLAAATVQRQGRKPAPAGPNVPLNLPGRDSSRPGLVRPL